MSTQQHQQPQQQPLTIDQQIVQLIQQMNQLTLTVQQQTTNIQNLQAAPAPAPAPTAPAAPAPPNPVPILPVPAGWAQQGPKLNKPEIFDGANMGRVDTFLAAVHMYLQMNPHLFPTEEAKI